MSDPDIRSFLQARGLSEAELDVAAVDGTLPLLVIDKLLFPNPPQYDEETLVSTVGVDPEVARTLWRAMGFPLVKEGDVVFFDEDLEALRIAVTSPTGSAVETVAVTRTMSAAMSRVAEQITDTFAEALRQLRESGASEDEIAAAFAVSLQPEMLDRMLAYMFRRQFRAVLWRRLAEPDRNQHSPDLTVGFVDLVRFAAVTEDVADEELERIVVRFEEVAHNAVTDRGGRLVKMIGDAVMYVADDPFAATEIALALVDAYANDDLLPPARAGLARGPALERGGDYFGPVVNLASRIVDVARPSRVVVSADLHAALAVSEAYAFRRLPPKRLKGMGMTSLWAVSHR